jgi:hypothetical protein
MIGLWSSENPVIPAFDDMLFWQRYDAVSTGHSYDMLFWPRYDAAPARQTSFFSFIWPRGDIHTGRDITRS